MTLVDTNVLIRYLTGDPLEQAHRAGEFLARTESLFLADLIAAECVYVLESFYEVPVPDVAALLRAIIGFPPIEVTDKRLLLRALEIYELDRLDFAEAFLVAQAERTGSPVASLDQSIDCVTTVGRVEP